MSFTIFFFVCAFMDLPLKHSLIAASVFLAVHSVYIKVFVSKRYAQMYTWADAAMTSAPATVVVGALVYYFTRMSSPLTPSSVTPPVPVAPVVPPPSGVGVLPYAPAALSNKMPAVARMLNGAYGTARQ